jgi:hypothetical protein
MKVCSKCLIKKPLDSYRIESSRNWRIPPDQRKIYYREECKECEKKLSKQLREAKKYATPKPIECECCGKKTENLLVDHDHQTGKFRGWLCKTCNIGIGKLGDNLSGLERAVLYLKRECEFQ